MSVPHLPPQLRKLLPLLSSDKDGEVIAAARAIGWLLGSAGLDFHDLAAALELPSRQPRRPKPVRSWQAPHADLPAAAVKVQWAQDHGGEWLPAKDITFLRDLGARLQRYGGRLSPAQAEWLRDICARVEARHAA